jgi:co-chaperonin GroES (HSP10)
MKYKATGTNILVEEIIAEDDQQIIADKEEFIVKGKVLNVGKKTGIEFPMSIHQQSGMGIVFEVVDGDIIWFNKRSATNLPFSDKLYVIEQTDILVVEKHEEIQ